jgi:hypothetical protein
LEQTLADARTLGASVSQGTEIAVVARIGIQLKDASHRGLAAIVGADILVVANDGLAGCAEALGTFVIGGTQITVVALCSLSRLVDTANVDIASIHCADVAVVAGKECSGDAISILA